MTQTIENGMDMDTQTLLERYGIEKYGSDPEFTKRELQREGLESVRAYVREYAVEQAIYPEDAPHVDAIAQRIWDAISAEAAA